MLIPRNFRQLHRLFPNTRVLQQPLASTDRCGTGDLFCSSTLDFQLRAGTGLCCRQTSRQHTEWRARHVIQSNLRAKLD